MISRRTLFARLSAIALAPLAKWLPKEEDHSWLTVVVDSQQPHVTVIDMDEFANNLALVMTRPEGTAWNILDHEDGWVFEEEEA